MQNKTQTKFSVPSPRRARQGGPASSWKETEIGTIPEEWDVFNIQTVSEIIGGGTPSTANEDNFNGVIPWITPRDLSSYKDRFISKGERYISKEGFNSSSAKLFPANTVLLTTRAPVGYLVIAKNEVTTNQGFHSLIPNNKTGSLFLFYLLKNNVQKLIDNASGSTFQELNGKTLKSLEFAFPKLSEQKQIAEILSSLDDKIELNRQINANLEKIASSLFKHWFVDFEFPFDFAQGRPDKNGKPYKSSGGEMIDSELGEIPDGWRIVPLGNYIKFEKGKKPKKTQEEKREGFIPQVLIETFDSGKSLFADPEGSIIADKKDVLMVMDGASSGRTEFGHYGVIGSTLSRVNFVNLITNEFLYFFLKTKEQDIKKSTTGTSIPHTDKEKIKNYLFALPDSNLINQFSNIAGGIMDQILTNRAEVICLSSIRDSLLPRLMNGKIRVK